MILDTSALVAILAGEPEAERLLQRLARARVRRLSAANFVELALVIAGPHGLEMDRQREAFLQRAEVIIEPVTVEQAQLARQAFLDYGRGRHPAGLNFGDCFAYALAQARREPLLFVGADFTQTDVRDASAENE